VEEWWVVLHLAVTGYLFCQKKIRIVVGAKPSWSCRSLFKRSEI